MLQRTHIWFRHKMVKALSRNATWITEVESSRMSLASRTSSPQTLPCPQLEDFGLWSLWPRSLKSSKIALSSARGQHYFLNRWNFVGKRQKPCRKFAKTFFCFPQVEIAWKKLFEDLFCLKKKIWGPFFEFAWKKILKTFFWRTLAPVSLASRGSVLGLEIFLCSWPREGLSLALKFFCVLGLDLEPSVLDSTSDG